METKRINIGIFDSGVGGLWILKYLREELPEYNYIFVADQKNVPYGPKSLEKVRELSERIVKFLIEKNCQLIVIACNTASGASLKYLREKFPSIIFIGMEPAVKPAAEITHTGKVAVLATPATFQGELYNSVIERFAQGVEIFQNTCDGLVEQIEKEEFNSDRTKDILRSALNPMLDKNIDTVVLGCTHYPFVIPQIQEIVGEKVKVIDPTPAIVRRVKSLLDENGMPFNSMEIKNGSLEIFTSSNPEKLEKILSKLINENIKIKELGNL